MKMKPLAKFEDFVELEEPVEVSGMGWYVATKEKVVEGNEVLGQRPLIYGYLHPDLNLYTGTGNPDGTMDSYPGYFDTEEQAIQIRNKYYAKHGRGTEDPIDAYNRAMKIL